MVLLILVYLIAPPALALVQSSLFTTTLRGEIDAFTLRYYVGLFEGGQLVRPLANSVGFAAGSAVLSLTLGGMIAWIVERTDAPLRGLGYFTVFASFGVPYVLYTIAWLLLVAENGPINRVLMSALELPGPPFRVNSLTGMILLEGFLWSPLVFLMLGSSFRSMDASLEEAGTMSGAGTLTTLRRVTLPLAVPAIVSAALLVFVRAIAAFEVPALVGMPGRVEVLTTRIFLNSRTIPPDYGEASAFAVILTGMLLVALAYYSRATRRTSRFQTITGKGFRPRVLELGGWRYVASAVLLVYVLLILVLPVLILLWASLSPFYVPPTLEGLSLVTLRNFGRALAYPQFGDALRNSLLLGVLSASIVMAITSLGAWLLVRGRSRLVPVVELLAGVPLVLPGTVLGLAIMRFYLQWPVLPIYATIWILLVAYVTHYIPYGLRYGHTGLLQVHPELEEAAAMSGASGRTRLRYVLLPLLAPSLVTGWIFVMLLSTKELSASVLLAGPASPVMSVAMFDLWTNGQITEAAAFGMLWVAPLIGLVVLLYWVGKKYGLQVQ